MSKKIEDLGGDIYGLLQSQKKLTPEEVADKMSNFGTSQGLMLNRALTERTEERKPMTIYASELGKKCGRQLWYTHNTPLLAEPLPAKTKFKFLYGDIVENAVLTLAEMAGHKVERKQEVVEFKHESGWVVRGRRDAVIDDVSIDVKSSSPFGMRKFAEGLDDKSDSFGYRQQLSFYNGVLVPEFGQQGFVAVDKQNGDIEYYESPWFSVEGYIDTAIENIEAASEPAQLANAEEDASFRNMKLATECSYCPFKTTCWRKANMGRGLMLVQYSSGPTWLTRVNKEPNAPTRWASAPSGAEEAIADAKEGK